MKIKITNPKLKKRVKELMKEREETEPGEYTLLRASFEIAYDEDTPDHAFLLRAGKELSALREAEENRKYKAGELWTPKEVHEFLKKVTDIWGKVLVGPAEPFPEGYVKRFPGIEEAIDECLVAMDAAIKKYPDLSKRK
jgi:hypothetical protein